MVNYPTKVTSFHGDLYGNTNPEVLALPELRCWPEMAGIPMANKSISAAPLATKVGSILLRTPNHLRLFLHRYNLERAIMLM
jgi:hypothetical protein